MRALALGTHLPVRGERHEWREPGRLGRVPPASRRVQREPRTQVLRETEEGDRLMRRAGRARKDGKYWLAEVPMLDALTRARSRLPAFRMMADLVETMADKKRFHVAIFQAPRGALEVGADDAAALVAVMLRSATREARPPALRGGAPPRARGPRRPTHGTSRGGAFRLSEAIRAARYRGAGQESPEPTARVTIRSLRASRRRLCGRPAPHARGRHLQVARRLGTSSHPRPLVVGQVARGRGGRSRLGIWRDCAATRRAACRRGPARLRSSGNRWGHDSMRKRRRPRSCRLREQTPRARWSGRQDSNLRPLGPERWLEPAHPFHPAAQGRKPPIRLDLRRSKNRTELPIVRLGCRRGLRADCGTPTSATRSGLRPEPRKPR